MSKGVFCVFFGLLLFFSSFVSSQMVFAEPDFTLEFGSFGTADGRFKAPSGLALDTDTDLLYVADTDNNRIQIIDVNGSCDENDDEYLAQDICFVDEFGGSGTGDGKFDSPTALALDQGSKLLYIADTGNDRIQIIDVDGNCSGSTKLADDVCYVDKFGSSGNDEGEFDSPGGLVLDTSNDILYVADTNNNRIQIIEVDGNCDQNDDEYLTDDVCFVDEFGGSGNGEGEFDLPMGLALHTEDDLLYVADSDNNQIQIIDIDGNCSGSARLANNICYVDEFGVTGNSDGEFNSPSGLAIDVAHDLLYVVDTENERIQIIDVDGNCGTRELANQVCFEDEFGKVGNDEGEFDLPMAIVLNTNDDLAYVADTENNRIQVFDLTGSATSSDAPSRPTGIEAYPISKTSIFITWDFGDPDEKITGYKIEGREGSEKYQVLASNTGSNANSFVHGGLSSSETYTYRVYAINAQGTSTVSSTASAQPEDSLSPAALTATAISDSKIKLSWFPPTDTFQQSIKGYIIERVINTGIYDVIADVGSQTTTYTVSGLQTDKQYTFVVRAEFGVGGSPRSNTASATPNEDAVEPTSSSITTPSAPTLTTSVISDTQVDLSWSKPSDGGSPISGYKIEVKKGSEPYTILEENTKNDSTKYSHTNLTPNTKYSYKVAAINGIGVGPTSNESSATPAVKQVVLEIKPLGRLSIDEGKSLAFIVGVSDSSIENVRYSLANNAPSGASIGSTSGSFTWTPSNAQSGTYTFDIIATSGSLEDRESITITVIDVPEAQPEPPKEPGPPTEPEEPKELGIAPFVDPSKDPQSYVDRYNNEATYKAWFDENYPEYKSIYEA
ncbi:MAG: fibronectin type III domain-containing protein, partial [Nitrosopumilaceae archaeon]|nr:fibronectin type III domain-containing protein [Nitrosopumilaceae archaeon]